MTLGSGARPGCWPEKAGARKAVVQQLETVRRPPSSCNGQGDGRTMHDAISMVTDRIWCGPILNVMRQQTVI